MAPRKSTPKSAAQSPVPAQVKSAGSDATFVRRSNEAAAPKVLQRKHLREVKPEDVPPDWNTKPQPPIGTASGNVHKHSSTASVDSALSAEASTFQPTPPEPVNHLIVGGTAYRGNVATAPVTEGGKTGKGKGKAKANVQKGTGYPEGQFDIYDVPADFTTDAVDAPASSNYVWISGMPAEDSDSIIETLCQKMGWKSKLRGMRVQSQGDHASVEASFFFDHKDEAAQAVSDVDKLPVRLNAHIVDQATYIQVPCDPSRDVLDVSEQSHPFDGQVWLDATYEGKGQMYTYQGVGQAVHELAMRFGDIYAFAPDDTHFPMMRFRVEYFAISSAKDALKTLNVPKSIGEWDVTSREVTAMQVFADTNNKNHIRRFQESADPRQQYAASPSGRSAWIIDNEGRQFLAPPPRLVPKTGAATFNSAVTPQFHGQNHPASSFQTPYQHPDGVDMGGEQFAGHGNHRTHGGNSHATCDPFLPEGTPGEPQHILKWKISNGLDVRTTIMLRNLPNHLTFRGLKEILDRSSFGKYDFSYLRIDFAENKNVGYGFVNFSKPADLIEFIEEYGNQKWCPGMKDRYGRVRDARFSYATIQGYDCLVEKFRNSAVMDEFKDFRPKLWYSYQNTLDRSLIGTEQEFPEANNLSKKQRSIDNASHIGLYATQWRGNGRRGRFSQYDRGTSAQIREDAYYHHAAQMSPVANGYSYGYGNYPYGFAYGPSMYAAPPPPPHYSAYVYGAAPSYPSYTAGNQYAMGGPVEHYDPFVAPQYNGGFGTGPNAPPSRLRTVSNGRLGGRPIVRGTSSQSTVPRIFENHDQYPVANGYYDQYASANGYHSNANAYYVNGYHTASGSNAYGGYAVNGYGTYDYNTYM